ncbi:MAG: PhnD/SsuA/transferrin family substrate-binding protein, partial [Caulobacteraceae bacterium]|nr:PhnD/SsuA/transferrin family substrate-binding protein [Caulobacteraceae bacterium]
MISRRTLATLAAAALAVCACGDKAHEAGGSKELRFSVLSTESAQNMGEYWRPILADLSSQTGLKVTPYFTSNYTLLIEAMKSKKTDAGWFSNRSGLEA